jgi:hypothetical protein
MAVDINAAIGVVPDVVGPKSLAITMLLVAAAAREAISLVIFTSSAPDVVRVGRSGEGDQGR